MSVAEDVAATEQRLERSMNRGRRQLRDEVLAAYRQRTAGKDQFDVLSYVLVRMDVDRLYDAAYARWPGDVNAPLGRIIQQQARAARAMVVWRQWQDILRRLPGDVVRAIREAA